MQDPIICSLLFKCLELYGDDIPIEFVLAHLYSVLKGLFHIFQK